MPWDFWLIFAVLAILLPWRGRVRMQKLLSLPQITGRDRIRLYLSTILFQWVLTAVISWRAFAQGFDPAALGLVSGGSAVFLVAVVGAVLIATGHWLNLRRMAASNHPAVDSLRAIGARVFPRTRTELFFYILLSATAGVCEEFIFRGFVMAALLRAGLPAWVVVLLSSVMFGVAHLYQGKGGTIGTGLLGTLFAMTRIAYHSLLPLIVWHSVLDIVAGIAGTRYLKNKQPEKTSSSAMTNNLLL
jgi:membrane protease YdiL (CAAX protease family)